jgi:hypothetical protein
VRRLIGVCILVLATACTDTTTTSEQAAEVAAALCKCGADPSTTCESNVATEIATPSSECISCVFDDTNACAAMQTDCVPLCITQQQPENP